MIGGKMARVVVLCIVFASIYSIHGQSITGGVGLRLVSRDGSVSSSLTEGRLELYYNSTWTTVCSTGFDANVAALACKRLGYVHVRRFGNVSSLGFTSGAEAVWIRQITCPTGVSQITDCAYGDVLCSHANDVALGCSNTDQTTDGEVIRLVTRTGRTTNISSGRLEVFVNGRWGTLCDDFFNAIDNLVACLQLGFPNPSTNGNVQNLRFSPGSSSTPIWLHALRCTLTDTNILDCPSGSRDDLDCDHNEDVAILCLGSGVLRLISANVKAPQSTGRLEIYLNGKWGTVNSTSFTDSAADVVCRQLGFTSAISHGNVSSMGLFEGIPSSPVWISSVDCPSDRIESIELILDCSVNVTAQDNSAFYVHTDDVGLICLNPLDTDSTSPPAAGSRGVIIGAVIGSILFLLLGSIILILVLRGLMSMKTHSKESTIQRTSFSATTGAVRIEDKAPLPSDQDTSSNGGAEEGVDGVPPPLSDNNPDSEPFNSSDIQPLV